jgi:hypothetical protein
MNILQAEQRGRLLQVLPYLIKLSLYLDLMAVMAEEEELEELADMVLQQVLAAAVAVQEVVGLYPQQLLHPQVIHQ